VPKPLAVVPELEAELDDLYAAPPEDFTRARNDLAQRLKQAGQVDAAARVKQLRKPTVPLWAVNQLARSHPDEVRALLAAGDRLRAAQQAALRGKSEELRKATAEEREVLRRLTKHAEDLLGQTGHPADTKRIADTLRAAAVAEAGRELLAQGRLSEELQASGFEAFAGMKIPNEPTPKAKKPPAPSPAARRRQQDRLRKLRAAVTKAKRVAAEAERAADAAEEALAEARQEAEQARESLRQAELELENAESEQ
jgi:hypothetical protein